jgi:hypothetical protein
MDDIDNLFSRIRDLPLDPRLDAIDDAVQEALARRARSRVSVSAIAMVAMISLGVGVVGAIAPARQARAATVFPLGAPPALAPSTLLGVG